MIIIHDVEVKDTMYHSVYSIAPSIVIEKFEAYLTIGGWYGTDCPKYWRLL